MEVEVQDTVKAPVDVVWARIRDFGDLTWSAVPDAKAEGEGIGAVRTITIHGGFMIQERLESLDDENHSFTYSIVEPSLFPVRNCVAQVRLTADGPNTTITWGARMDPDRVTEEQAGRLMRAVFQSGVRGLKRVFSSR